MLVCLNKPAVTNNIWVSYDVTLRATLRLDEFGLARCSTG